MAETICIFEDSTYSRLYPLAYTRPVYDLRCGIRTLREKILHAYPRVPVSLFCRGFLTDLVRLGNPGVPVNTLSGKSCLFINGRVIAQDNFSRIIPLEGDDTLYVAGNMVIAARVSGSALRSLATSETFSMSSFTGLLQQEIKVKYIEYPWDLVNNNGAEILADFRALIGSDRGVNHGMVYEGAYLLGKENIFIDEGATIKPGVVVDAEKGPIYIGKNVMVLPNAAIEGPAYIGDGSTIKIGAKIYENTSIGAVCKVGGEVEGSIIHSYSNKQHDGFLGHSYLGMWVNLGADTNTSDLKNNYGTVRMQIDGNEVDTGSLFVGLIMGDHSKSGINTMFNTGTAVGVSCNIFGGGFPPKSIPSFSWGGSEGLMTYRLDRSLEVARSVIARRKITMSGAEEQVLRRVFDLTAAERAKAGVRDSITKPA